MQAEEENPQIDYAAAIKAYEDARAELLPYVAEYCNAEIAAMEKMAEALRK